MSKNTCAADFSHYSVMLYECIDGLDIKQDGIYCDLTLGGGGHSEQIAKRLKDGKLVCVDTDITAIKAASARLAEHNEKITFVNNNFKNIGDVLDELGIEKIDGALIDLGVSSFQLDCAERGFSYMNDAPLDMRMNTSDPLSAYDVVNTYSEDELKRIIYTYGEENFAPQIASKIVSYRAEKPIETTLELVDIIKSAMPAKAKVGGHHPAKRTFQAIRIAVNSELDIIEPTLKTLISRLNKGGRLCVITFHSLEDRIVKQTFAHASSGCTCPPEFPVCVCGKTPLIKTVTKKPILPSDNELEENPRSRSAKLRVAEKL
mgnify:CR=1 FL=1